MSAFGGKADIAIAAKRAVAALKEQPFRYASLSRYDALSRASGAAMPRRGKAGGKSIKAQRSKTLTRRIAPEGMSSHSNRQENIARELHEAREQQIATAEILRVIRTSPNDVQPVFETIVRNAVSLCGGLFANVFRFDGELLHYVASHNLGPSYADMIRAKYPMRPDASQVSGRVVLTKSVVWLQDALADPDYDQRFPVAMGWRRLLGVPMLREGKSASSASAGGNQAQGGAQWRRKRTLVPLTATQFFRIGYLCILGLRLHEST
jgi:hypothetical protein